MTLQFGFYNSVGEDRLYDAVDMSRIFDGMILDGVYAAIGDNLMVVENANMNVAVGTGRAWFDHSWSYNDAEVVVAVPTADALLPRIDVVYIEINQDSGVRANEFDILEGTPATEPVAPTLTNTSTVHQYPLAHIEVAATVTEITQANIVNKVGTEECPFVICPLEYVTTNAIVAQWEAEWEEWFDSIKDQLSSEAETNLQAQIWDLAGVESGAPPYADDMVSLAAHDHSGAHDQIPPGGLETGAVTEAKIATGAVTNTKLGALAVTAPKIDGLAVTEGKLGPKSVVASKLGNNIAGDGLGGGDGLALSVNVDASTIVVASDILKVPTEGITDNEIENLTRYIFLPAVGFLPVVGAIKTPDSDYLTYLEYVDSVMNHAVSQFMLPPGLVDEELDVYLVHWNDVTGNMDWEVTFFEFAIDKIWDLPLDTWDEVIEKTFNVENLKIKHSLLGTYTPTGSLLPVEVDLIRHGESDANGGDELVYGLLLAYTASR